PDGTRPTRPRRPRRPAATRALRAIPPHPSRTRLEPCARRATRVRTLGPPRAPAANLTLGRASPGLAGRRQRAGRRGDPLSGQPVADAMMGVDVSPPRRDPPELGAHLAHMDIDRPVAARHLIAPHALVDRFARKHATLPDGEHLQHLE